MSLYLSFRIETAFPVMYEELKKQVRDFMEIHWLDNVKSRIVDQALSNRYNHKNMGISNRSQFETYFMVKWLGNELRRLLAKR
ncbi:MAG: hypothetical protein ACOYOA_11490 [Saprospiraceae bacterium]